MGKNVIIKKVCFYLTVIGLGGGVDALHAHPGHSHGGSSPKQSSISSVQDNRLMKTGKNVEIVVTIPPSLPSKIKVYLTAPLTNLPMSNVEVMLKNSEGNLQFFKREGPGTYAGILDNLPNRQQSKNNTWVFTLKTKKFKETVTFKNIKLPYSSEASCGEKYAYMLGSLFLILLILLSIFYVKKKRKNIYSPSVFLLWLSLSPKIFGHGGHDHSHAGAHEHASKKKASQIRKNGFEIVIPKDVQIHLHITTEKAQLRSLKQVLRLIGQVMSNPAGYARLQASQNSRVLHDPDYPLPFMGQEVKKDQIVLSLQPAIGKIETSVEKTALYKIESEIDQLRRDVSRKEKLGSYVSEKDLEIARSELDRSLKQRHQILGKTFKPEYLKSPIDGTVSDLHVRPGEIVPPEKTIVEILDPSQMLIEAFLFETNLSDEIVGGEVRLPLKPDKTIPLTLLGVSPKVNKEDQSVHLLFNVSKKDLSLKLDMIVEVLAELRSSKKTLTIPKKAIVEDQTGSWVFVKINPETFEPRQVRVNRYVGKFAEILEGVDLGEIVAVDGAYLLNHAR